MVKLSYAMAKALVDAYGQKELLRRLADPLWFQAFGCVLGFDWHSSGVTTVVTGVLKQSLKYDVHGMAIAGGKGKKATSAMYDIPRLAEQLRLSSSKVESLMYASKMSAKVDSAAVQDGYSLYHHTIIFDEDGDWTVVQQGMNPNNRMARRYHWISDSSQGFVVEPHAGIICEQKSSAVLDMTSNKSCESQRVALDIVRGNPMNLQSSIYKILNSNKKNNTLDAWIGSANPARGSHKGSNNTDDSSFAHSLVASGSTESNTAEKPYNQGNVDSAGFPSVFTDTAPIFTTQTTAVGYEMPRRLDWDLFRRIYDVQPKNYEDLLSMSGVGSATVRALALVAELIYGTPASWTDPVKYSFAHGGKDGVPYTVARKVYDESIKYLEAAIEGAELERQERIVSLKKLAQFSETMFSYSNNTKSGLE